MGKNWMLEVLNRIDKQLLYAMAISLGIKIEKPKKKEIIKYLYDEYILDQDRFKKSIFPQVKNKICKEYGLNPEISIEDVLRKLDDFFNSILEMSFKESDDKSISEIASSIQSYLDSAAQKNVDSKNNAELLKAFYFLEHIIYEEKKNIKIKKLIDPKIFSSSILSSFSDEKTSKNKYLRAYSYQILALNFLTQKIRQIGEAKLLIELADEFFQETDIGKYLTYNDIKINKSGGTRCKEAFKAAVGQMSALGLISRDNEAERKHLKYLSTYFGIVVLSYLVEKESDIKQVCFHTDMQEQDRDFLNAPSTIVKYVKVHPAINYTIHELNQPHVLPQFIDSKFPQLNKEESIIAKELFNQYINIYVKNVKIETNEKDIPTRIKLIPGYKKDIGDFFNTINNKPYYSAFFHKILVIEGIFKDDKKNDNQGS